MAVKVQNSTNTEIRTPQVSSTWIKSVLSKVNRLIKALFVSKPLTAEEYDYEVARQAELVKYKAEMTQAIAFSRKL